MALGFKAYVKESREVQVGFVIGVPLFMFMVHLTLLGYAVTALAKGSDKVDHFFTYIMYAGNNLMMVVIIAITGTALVALRTEYKVWSTSHFNLKVYLLEVDEDNKAIECKQDVATA